MASRLYGVGLIETYKRVGEVEEFMSQMVIENSDLGDFVIGLTGCKQKEKKLLYPCIKKAENNSNSAQKEFYGKTLAEYIFDKIPKELIEKKFLKLDEKHLKRLEEIKRSRGK